MLAPVAGTTGPGSGSPGGRGIPWRIIVVVLVVVVVALSATVYFLLGTPKPGPNTPPHGLSIQVSPATGNTTTVFTFTAQATDDQDPTSALQVRWDWQSDGVWDTSWSTTKTATHAFSVAGPYTVRVSVEDTGGLTANTTTSVTVSPSNLPPVIQSLVVSPSSGTNATTFNFTVTVTDDHDPSSSIQVRWDWQSDGTWDTNWSTTKTAEHRFPVAGNYTVAVQARDSAGLLSRATVLVPVGSLGPPPPPFRIGTIFSLTGGLAAFGGPQQNAVEMAVAEINSAGGVLGRPIQLFSLDDGTNPATAAQDAFTLVNSDHVDVIVGATASGSCAAIVPIATANSVLEVSPSCTSPLFSNLTVTGGWFARTVPSDALQAVVAAAYMYNNLSLRRAAVIGINNTYGVSTANAFAQNFTILGGTMTSPPLIVDEVTSGVTDYTQALASVLNTNPAPQIVYVVAYPPDGATMMENWWTGIGTYPAWADVNWSFSEGLYDQSSFINPLVSQGVNVSKFWGTSPAAYAGFEPPAYAAWASAYATRYGVPPTLFAANAYDATYLAALGAQAAGNFTGAMVRAHLQTVADAPGTLIGPGQWSIAVSEIAALHDINYNGASGSVDVGPHGDVPGSMIIWGINATNQIVTREFFNESLVVSLAPWNVFIPSPLATGPALAAAWDPEPG